MSKPGNSYTLWNGYRDIWDESIIDTLPENKRDGNVLFREGLQLEYFQVYATAVVVFGTIFAFWKTFFTMK